MRLPEVPSILVLLVATDGELWLPDVLKGLRAQRHSAIKVIAIDNASTDGSARILRKAFGKERVISLERRVGYGRALAVGLQIASERELEADAVLLLHDDTALQPGAIEAMIQAMRSDSIGVVGAKLLEWDDERVLQDIGGTTDRYGRIVSGVERGELDQGQHEGIHEVLYATSAAMMVSTEVIEKVGLFDVRYVALRDDLDLCWRARLAGFRTVVATDAAARHVAATLRDQRAGPARKRIRYFGDRNMIATLIKNYSVRRLLVALPVTVLVSLLNVVLYVVRGRRTAAIQVLEALRWNLTHLPSTLRARRRAQGTRAVPDAEVASLMHHGAGRVRAQIERAVEKVVGEIEEITDEQLEAPPARLIDRVRAHPGGVAITVAVVVALLGIRPLLASGSVAGLDMPVWPSGPGAFFEEFASGWRGTGAGGAGPATPGLPLLGFLTALSFGSGWLAQRLILFALPVLGAIGVVRIGRALEIGGGGRRLSAVVYATSPLMFGAFGDGRLPDLILVASAPWLLLPVLRAAGVLPRRGWRTMAAGMAGTAAVCALSPWAIVFVAASGLVLAASSSRAPRAKRTLRATGGIVIGALVLLLPWSIELFRPGSALGEGGAGPARSMVDLLALSAGHTRPVPIVLGFGIVLSGLGGAMVAPKHSRKAVVALGSLAIVGTVMAWLVARGVPWIAPRPTLPLIALAVPLSIFCAMGYEVARATLGGKTFGGAHIASGMVGLVLAIELGATGIWVAGGDRPGIVSADALSLASLVDEAGEVGAFRVLWLGGTSAHPTMALTGPAGETMRGYLARRAGSGLDATREMVAAMLAGSTEHAGRMLATAGVRYVIVRSDADAQIRDAVSSQPDLDFAQRLAPPGELETLGETTRATGALVYRNDAGLPVAAVVDEPGWVDASDAGPDALAVAEAAPHSRSGLARPTPDLYRGAVSKGRVLLLAEDFSTQWRARIGRVEYQARPSFGWATRFLGPAEGNAVVWFAGQRWHRGAILLNVLLIAAFVIWRSHRLARDRGER